MLQRSSASASVEHLSTTVPILFDSPVDMEDADGLPELTDVSTLASELHLTNGVVLQGTSVAEGDDRSSSLSDIDDGPEEDDADDNDASLGEIPAQDDSEAETERLENSPQKAAKHKNVVLSSELREAEQSPGGTMQHSTGEQLKEKDGSVSVESMVHEDILCLGISNSDRESRAGPNHAMLAEPLDSSKTVPSPPEIAGKKRKRTSPRSQELYEENENAELMMKPSSVIKSEPNGNSMSNQNSLSDQDIEERQKELEATISEIDAEHANDDEKAVKDVGQVSSSTKVKKGRTGKRKGKKLREVAPLGTVQSNSIAVDDGYSVEDGQVPDVDTIEEEEEAALVEGDGEEAEAELAARTEEECESL